jgi:rhomboid family GlyGly-CTERM serine protease
MNTITVKTSSNKLSYIREHLHNCGLSPDILTFLMLILFTNTHLVTGNLKGAYAFFPSAVVSGEWWRLLLHPFVHLTWYHLILDAGAFFLLYKELRPSKRITYVLAAGTSSLIAAILTSPAIKTLGLCGLSGIAHGLMAVSALELMQEQDDFRLGFLCFIVVVSKSMYEAFAGDVLFSFLHFGLCGTPIAVSHAGGVLGGIIAYSAMNFPFQNNGKAKKKGN